MKNIPNKIYLQVDPENEKPETFIELGTTWCSERIYDNDIPYYRKQVKVEPEVKPANSGSGLAEKLYNWMVKQKFSTGELLNATVCCDYAGKRWFINTMQDIIDNHLSV